MTNLRERSSVFATKGDESTGRFEIIYEMETTLTPGRVVKVEVSVSKHSGDFIVKAATKK
ncbi:hypothetical protein [Chryseobacterium sp. MP_3.2]|uniref:hypothetical protein n=1 Tax=Chryseobacterium sp. MP_3.2 TaxID=3071712 RepID=UPI002DFEFD63|nr:hypothetical protein [Chryseobacterium sp. MP_3.2]